MPRKKTKRNNKSQTKKNKSQTKKNKSQTKKNKKEGFIKDVCNVNNNSGGNFTCYTSDVLEKLKSAWNKKHPEEKINYTDNLNIWKHLKDKLHYTCRQESCWMRKLLNKLDNKKKLINDFFAPFAPDEWKKNPNEWLSSVDISKVMKQYEKKYKNFEFIGPSPIDYDTQMAYGECVWEELCNFNLDKLLKRNLNKIGIIFNLDPHYKGGSHWVSLFIDIKSKYIYYFDSVGDKIPRQIKKLCTKIQAQGNKLGIELNFDEIYPHEHQKKDTECGVYSIYFITNMIKTINTWSDKFKKGKISDNEMTEYRKVYFNTVY
jgi:hypothetical protein